MKDFLIYVAGPKTAELISELKYYSLQLPIALVLDSEYIQEETMFGFTVVSFDHLEKTCPPERYEIIP